MFLPFGIFLVTSLFSGQSIEEGVVGRFLTKIRNYKKLFCISPRHIAGNLSSG